MGQNTNDVFTIAAILLIIFPLAVGGAAGGENAEVQQITQLPESSPNPTAEPTPLPKGDYADLKIASPQLAPETIQSIYATAMNGGSSEAGKMRLKTDSDPAGNLDLYLFRTSSPIHFSIYLYLNKDAVKKAKLFLRAYDVDQEGAPGCGPEVDNVYFNGHFVGTLSGANSQWSTVSFDLQKEWLNGPGDTGQFWGRNDVRIDIDTTASNCWAVQIDYGILQVDAYPIIFVPGIAGTQLLASGNVLLSGLNWINLPAMYESDDDAFLDSLALAANGRDPATPGAKIEPNMVIRRVQAKDLVSIFAIDVDEDVYDVGMKYFRDKGYYSHWTFGEFRSQIPANVQAITPVELGNALFFEFPYDWRLALSDTAVQLGRKIEDVKASTEARKVIVIAHSMGGLVTRGYAKGANAQNIKWVFFLGTPHLGAPKAYKILKVGDNMGFEHWSDILDPERVKSMTQNMPGVYHLLPTRDYFSRVGRILNDKYEDPNANGLLDYNATYKTDPAAKLSNTALVDQADAFHQSLPDFSVFERAYLMAGIKGDTIHGAHLEEDFFGTDFHFDFWEGDGDETVPTKSALAEGVGGWDVKATITNIEHGKLFSEKKVDDWVWKYIKQNVALDPTLSISAYSDFGTDKDGDGLYDYLTISISGTASVNGTYGFSAWLNNSNGTISATSSNETYFETGFAQTIYLNFRGSEINSVGINGTYSLSFDQFYEGEDQNARLEDAYETSPYNTGQLESEATWPQSFFPLAYNESVIDMDGDSKFDFLRMGITANITEPGNYELFGLLNTSGGNVTAFTYNSTDLLPGINEIYLHFPGIAISAAGLDGPFYLAYKATFRNRHDSFSNVVATAPYSAPDFSPAPMSLGGLSYAAGQDSNGNSLYERLVASVLVYNENAGNYYAFAELADANGSTIAGGAMDPAALPGGGSAAILLEFDGREIRASGRDGPYKIRGLRVYREDGAQALGVSFVNDTPQFSHSQFEPPQISLGGNITEMPIDTNGNGLYEMLAFTIPIYSSMGDIFDVNSRLVDQFGQEIGWASTSISISGNSTENVTLEFNGRLINGNGLDGPYTLSDLSVNGAFESLLIAEAHVTAAYAYADFEPAAIISGRVLAESSVPIEGAIVSLSGPMSRAGVTDANGSFSLSATLNGTYTLMAFPPSGANFLQNSTTLLVVVGNSYNGTDLILPEGSIFSGTVLMENGTAIENAVVSISALGISAPTNASGMFYFSGLPAGSYYASVEPPAGSNLMPNDTIFVQLIKGNETNILIELESGAILRGTVMDYLGNPVYYSSVVISGSSVYRYTFTDANGSYNFDALPDAELEITATPPTGSELVLNDSFVNITRGTTTQYDIFLPLGGILGGMLRDYDGNPVRGGSVFLNGPYYYSNVSDVNGTFRIAGMVGGEYSLAAYPPADKNYFINYTSANITQGAVNPLDVFLEEGGGISGRVVDSYGHPVFDAYVAGDLLPYPDLTNPGGEFDLIRLDTGSYGIYAYAPLGSGLSDNLTNTIEVTRGETETLEIILPGNYTPIAGGIRGFVTGISGEPLPGVVITTVPFTTYLSTDYYGYYELIADQETIHNVTATPGYYYEFPEMTKSATVTFGAITTVNFSYAPEPPTPPANHSISSCSDDPDSAGEWKLAQNISSPSGSCLNFLTEDVLLNCNGHSINGNGTGMGINLTNMNNSIIKNCTISGFFFGMGGVIRHNNTFENNTLVSNRYGMFISGGEKRQTIAGNLAINNNNFGIYIASGGSDSIQNNLVSGSEIGYFLGAQNTNFTNNTASGNSLYGLQLQGSLFNGITYNDFMNNGIGLLIVSSSLNTFHSNQFENNSIGMNTSGSSDNNLIYNNIFENAINARTDRPNYWNASRQPGINIIGGAFIGGNFWSDYNGGDTDGDGIGDTLIPHTSSGGISSGGDYLPLFGGLQFICGDVDGSGEADAVDSIFLDGYLHGGAPIANYGAADINADGLVDILDLALLVDGVTYNSSLLLCNDFPMINETAYIRIGIPVLQPDGNLSYPLYAYSASNVRAIQTAANYDVSRLQLISSDELLVPLSAPGIAAVGDSDEFTGQKIISNLLFRNLTNSTSKPLLNGPVAVDSFGRKFMDMRPWMCGDANGDLKVTSADVIYLVNYAFRGGPAPDPVESGDVNDYGAITSADIIYLVNYVFKGGPAPNCGSTAALSGSTASASLGAPLKNSDGTYTIQLNANLQVGSLGGEFQISIDPEKVRVQEAKRSARTSGMDLFSEEKTVGLKIGFFKADGSAQIPAGSGPIITLITTPLTPTPDFSSVKIASAELVDPDARLMPIALLKTLPKSVVE